MSTILLIDDDEQGLRVREYLMQSVGYAVLSATTAVTAVELLKANPVDLIILDYHMPEMDGAEALTRIRVVKPEVPVVLLSGIMNVPESLTGQVQAVVVKGAGAQKLLDTVAEQLKGRKL